MTPDVSGYLAMQRACYAGLVERSRFDSEAFAGQDDGEFVVGSYAQHEAFDYERWLFGGMRIGAGAVALDYGCGPGRMLLRLASAFRRIDGVDISAEVLEVARRRTRHLPVPPHTFLTDGQGLPTELDGAYDVAYSVICLQHISVHAIRLAILKDLYRALKPGGVLTFQLGYGPGHVGMVDYFDEQTDAPASNGAMDVTVLHPSDVALDLDAIGFIEAAYALTPTGPGDTHGAWMFVRAVKPGVPSAFVSPGGPAWASQGFAPLQTDPAAAARARRVHAAHSITARVRQLQDQVATLQRALVDVELDCDRERRRGNALDRQLQRLRTADRDRVSRLVTELAERARAGHWRVGVFGAGAHTEWLFRETPLQTVPSLSLFDSSPAMVGRVVEGVVVRPAQDMAAMPLQAVVVSSLAFQDEMVAQIESLGLNDTQIVRCYP